MTKRTTHAAMLALMSFGGVFALVPAFGQTPSEQQVKPDQPQAEAAYTPPLRGAPAKRLGGASRSAIRPAAPLPMIELLAPADHAGEAGSATPVLCYFVSRRVDWPMQLTIRAPLQQTPVLEATIPSAPRPGLYALRLADYRTRLEPGVAYTWSVSIVLDPKAWSRNIVASAVILRTPPAAETERGSIAATPQRALLLAHNGLWYDAVAAAFESGSVDGRQILVQLMRQVGLVEAVRFEQAVTSTSAGR